MKKMTFFARFVDDILAERKTITIRDTSEANLHAGDILDVSTLEAVSYTHLQMRGRLMAFNSATQNFASGFAALLAGLIMTQAADGRILNFDWVGYLSCVFGLAAIWMARRVKAVS